MRVVETIGVRRDPDRYGHVAEPGRGPSRHRAPSTNLSPLARTQRFIDAVVAEPVHGRDRDARRPDAQRIGSLAENRLALDLIDNFAGLERLGTDAAGCNEQRGESDSSPF